MCPRSVSHRSPQGVCARGAGVCWREMEAVRVFVGGGSAELNLPDETVTSVREA